MKRLLPVVTLAVLVPAQAHAYLDAGTGSMILQGLLAAAFGAAFTLKLYWHRFKAFIAQKTSKPEEE